MKYIDTVFNLGLLAHFCSEDVPILVYFGTLLCVLLIAYLLGSINSAILFSRLIYHEDIRTKGSGNAGMTNMLRSYGKNAALLTLFGDLGKTVIALLIAASVFGFNYMNGIAIGGLTGLGECYLAGLFAVLGHVFPIYYKFKGGKGVLVTSTMALVLTPVPFALLFIIFAGVVYFSKYVSLGSITIAMLYPICLQGYFGIFFGGALMPAFTAIASITLAILIVWCHRANIVRIGNRTENKLSFGKKND